MAEDAQVALTVEQQLRYARHLTLPGFGVEAQRKLMKSSVLLVGAGGLGSPAALYLAAAGVGRLGIVDDDVVDLTNLQRQILHRTCDTGVLKTTSAKRALTDCNPEVTVEPIAERFGEGNARELVRAYDLVMDGADNFPTRYLINDAAVLEGRRVVHGSIFLFEGQVAVCDPPRGPCYRCLFPDPPQPGSVPSCAEAGVLGVLPGVIGCLQATEAIKLLTGLGDPLVGQLLTYDALDMTFRKLRVKRDPGCPVCGGAPTIKDVELMDWSCAAGDADVLELDASAYRQLREAGEDHVLVDVREAQEVAAGHIEGHVPIPLGQLDGRLRELDAWRNRLVVCQCQSGIRSLRAAQALRLQGFGKVANLSGGYLAWLAEVEKRGGT